jgi:predicted negative regulator of RcsB-dependent stress response
MMIPLLVKILIYGLIIIAVVGVVWWYRKQNQKSTTSLNSEDCQAIQVELYRQTTYLIGEMKMEMDELRGALATAQSEAEALKVANAQLVAKLAEAGKVPDDVAAQVNTLVTTLAS